MIGNVHLGIGLGNRIGILFPELSREGILNKSSIEIGDRGHRAKVLVTFRVRAVFEFVYTIATLYFKRIDYNTFYVSS